jgi:hypothetical protein
VLNHLKLSRKQDAFYLRAYRKSTHGDACFLKKLIKLTVRHIFGFFNSQKSKIKKRQKILLWQCDDNFYH